MFEGAPGAVTLVSKPKVELVAVIVIIGDLADIVGHFKGQREGSAEGISGGDSHGLPGA